MPKIVPYPSIDHLKIDSKKNWKGTNDDEKNNHKFYFEEKIDGSQLSILINNNKLEFYNKQKLINPTNSVFQKSIIMLNCKYENKNILNSEYIYHGEAVCNLKHNVNVYSRTPKYYFMVYDIYDLENKQYLSLEDKHNECNRVGLEYVQVLYQNLDIDCNPYKKADELIKEIESELIKSCLGGIPEGIVLKHHNFVYKGKRIATKLKYVTNLFKERHKKAGKHLSDSPETFLEKLGQEFNVHPRFQKAYQHLVESNLIDPNHRNNNDIIQIVNELDIDFDKEYREEIMMLLWAEFSPIIKKNARKNVGKWYMNNYMMLNAENKVCDIMQMDSDN